MHFPKANLSFINTCDFSSLQFLTTESQSCFFLNGLKWFLEIDERNATSTISRHSVAVRTSIMFYTVQHWRPIVVRSRGVVAASTVTTLPNVWNVVRWPRARCPELKHDNMLVNITASSPSDHQAQVLKYFTLTLQGKDMISVPHQVFMVTRLCPLEPINQVKGQIFTQINTALQVEVLFLLKSIKLQLLNVTWSNVNFYSK